MRGHSVGGFGSVTTNKVIATIAGDVFGKDVQAYPKYGSEKKGLPDHLLPDDRRFAHLHSTASWSTVDFVCINDPTAILSPEPLNGLVARRGHLHAVAVTPTRTRSGCESPSFNRRTIREKKLRVYFADMVSIAREVASVADLQMRMQGIVLLGAFLKLTPYARQSEHDRRAVYAGVEKALRKYFGKRGDRVVQDNLTCVQARVQRDEGDPRGLIFPDEQAVPQESRDEPTTNRNARDEPDAARATDFARDPSRRMCSTALEVDQLELIANCRFPDHSRTSHSQGVSQCRTVTTPPR